MNKTEKHDTHYLNTKSKNRDDGNITYTCIKESTDWFVVADGECRVADVGPLFDLSSLVEDSITPGGRTMLLTENNINTFTYMYGLLKFVFLVN